MTSHGGLVSGVTDIYASMSFYSSFLPGRGAPTQ